MIFEAETLARKLVSQNTPFLYHECNKHNKIYRGENRYEVYERNCEMIPF